MIMLPNTLVFILHWWKIVLHQFKYPNNQNFQILHVHDCILKKDLIRTSMHIYFTVTTWHFWVGQILTDLRMWRPCEKCCRKIHQIHPPSIKAVNVAFPLFWSNWLQYYLFTTRWLVDCNFLPCCQSGCGIWSSPTPSMNTGEPTEIAIPYPLSLAYQWGCSQYRFAHEAILCISVVHVWVCFGDIMSF